NDSMQSILPAVFPMIKDTFHLSFVQVGAISLVIQLTSSLIQPWVGLYADKHRHSWQLSVAMVFSMCGVVILALATSYWMILLAVGLMGVGSAVFHPQAAQIAQAASGGRKGFAQSVFQVGGNGGYSIGPLLAAFIVLPIGMQAFGYIAIIPFILAVILYQIGKWHMAQIGKVVKKVRGRWTTVKTYSKRRIWFFIFVLFMLMFSKNFYSTSMLNYFSFFLIDKFVVTQQTAQYCLFIYLAAQAIGTIVGGMLGDKYGRKWVIWFSILGVSPFTIALPYIDSFTGVVILSIVIAIIMASAFSSILVFASDLMPNNTGVIAGIFYGLSFGVAGIGSSFFGWLADQTSIHFVFEVSTLLPLLGIIAVFLPKMKKEVV
ncbi:MAG: MFS transporter, partial [Prevotellaceae bacterium]|nr:MFS transporter [Prevotellaceae bacterium]